jgi:ribosomal protein L11 methyltransferase
LKTDYWELKIQCTEEVSDIITALLGETEFESFIYEDESLKAYVKGTYFTDIASIQSEVEQLLSALPFELDYSVDMIQQQNWNETWEKQFEPILIDNKCIVRAPFHHEVENLLNIIIEPKMSFGTGHHQTTFMMLNQLHKIDLRNKSILDMGCGTAVLAILCEKLNAKNVIGIDIEDWAFENSIENVHLNGCKQVEIRLGGAEMIGDDSFDVIIANINKNILKNDMHIYNQALKQNGLLLLSGFFFTDVPELTKIGLELKLKEIEIVQKDEWALLILQK